MDLTFVTLRDNMNSLGVHDAVLFLTFIGCGMGLSLFSFSIFVVAKEINKVINKYFR